MNAIQRKELEQRHIAMLLGTISAPPRSLEAIQWRADWLHSSVLNGSDPWFIRTPKSRLVNGVWEDLTSIEWNFRLLDGTNMAEPINHEYREFLQKVSFLIHDHTNTDFESGRSYINDVYSIRTIAKWASIHSKILNFRKDFFSRLTEENCELLLSEFSQRGTFGLLRIPERFIRAATKSCSGSLTQLISDQNNLFNLDDRIRDEISEWLSENGYYRYSKNNQSTNGSLRYISRDKLCTLLGVERQTLKSQTAIAFFRQFEPEFLKRFPNLCIRVGLLQNEYPSHKVLTLAEAAKLRPSGSHIVSLLRALDRVFSLSDLFPHALPVRTEATFETFTDYVKKAPAEGHTPWMPFGTALTYMNESLRWVTRYGVHLVDFYLKAWSYFVAQGWIGSTSATMQEELRPLREQWFLANIPITLKSLNLSGWGPGMDDNAHTSRRNHPSMSEVMPVFIGACLYLLTGLVPSRSEEVADLNKDCLSLDNEGWYVTKSRKKAVVADNNLSMTVPVPNIYAQTVSLLAALSNGVYSTIPDEYRNKPSDHRFLLNMPDFRRVDIPYLTRYGKGELNRSLDSFCDYVNLAPDSLGRRWYARIHENRKSFILTFVWCYKFAALDAIRALAGHTDIDHVLAYIKANMPGVEISELESDYLAFALWDYSSSGKKIIHVVDIEKLYKRVCKKFKVREISEIREEELKDWLEIGIVNETFKIDTCNLVDENSRRCIALRISMKS